VKRVVVVMALALTAAGWLVAASRVPRDEEVAPPSTAPTVLAGPAEQPRVGPRRKRSSALYAAAAQFLEAFTRYEVGIRGARWRSELRRSTTPTFARELLGRPPRVPSAVARAGVARIVLGRPRRGRAAAVARVLRSGRPTMLIVVLVRRAGGWRVAEVRR
jgi:hypothetical protein